jgi:hypothetical protein
MQYLPTIDLTPQIRLLLARRALRLQPGQWVRESGARGRYLRTNPATGVTYVSWVRPGDRWRDAAQRFHRACVKGFVGRYAPLYDLVKARREAARAARPLPEAALAA